MLVIYAYIYEYTVYAISYYDNSITRDHIHSAQVKLLLET